MTMDLFWSPAVKKYKGLPDELKFILRKKYGGTINATVNSGDIEYLNALQDADINGAEELIEAIHKHGEVNIFEE